MSSLASVSLDRVLGKFSGNYTNLFTPKGGYLVALEGGGWKVEKLEPRDLATYYQSIVEALIRDREYRNIANPVRLIERINYFFTNGSSFCETTKKSAIFFNSKIPSYSYLSNFFPTLILCEDCMDSSVLTLYPSSENAYQTYKIASLAIAEREEILVSIKKIGEGTPLDSKREAAAFYIPLTDDSAEEKYIIMKKIVKKKFEQNAVLAKLLKETAGSHLIEESGDTFWGSSKPVDYKDLEISYHSAPSQRSKNCLGRAIMEVRDEMFA